MEGHQKDKDKTETEHANQQINKEFYDEKSDGTEEMAEPTNETAQANLEINEKFDSDRQAERSSPTSYQNNNMAAVDVTNNEKRRK